MNITEPLKAEVLRLLESGVTRYAIAKDSGLNFNTLNRWLEGEGDIRLESADALAEYLGAELKFRKAKKK